MYLYPGIYLNIFPDWRDYCTLCLDAHVALHSELSTDDKMYPMKPDIRRLNVHKFSY